MTAIDKFRKRRADRLADRHLNEMYEMYLEHEDEWTKEQSEKHPRSKNGRFARKGQGEIPHDEMWERKEAKQNKQRKNILVSGPADSKRFIERYKKEHPEFDAEEKSKKYKGMFSKVKDFKTNHPEAENYHSYDPDTAKVMDPDHGYCVTFHQNYKKDDKFGAYDDDTYAYMCAIAENELKPEEVYIGYFDNPEVSFNCPDKKTAYDFARKHNQYSVWNANLGREWRNRYGYDPKYNPFVEQPNNKPKE